MVESKTANSVDYNLIIFNNNKTFFGAQFTLQRVQSKIEKVTQGLN